MSGEKKGLEYSGCARCIEQRTAIKNDRWCVSMRESENERDSWLEVECPGDRVMLLMARALATRGWQAKLISPRGVVFELQRIDAEGVAA